MSRDGRKIVVVGAGIGGLTAALRLARAGYDVQVIEAREDAGGLASAFEQDGFVFDAGPYILLDRPGLTWAFRALGLDLTEHIMLRQIEDVYQVAVPDGPSVHFYTDLAETAADLERTWPGSGKRYERFVESSAQSYRRLEPMLHISQPGPADLVRWGAWRDVPFLMRSLGACLASTGLPAPVIDAMAIWTHIAAQKPSEAPSVLAFVPAMIHTIGAFYPVGGVGTIARALLAAAYTAGVDFQFGTKVGAIRCAQGRVIGVETAQGKFIPADAVVSDASAVGTYLELLDGVRLPASVENHLRKLPLQSPGVCAYLAIRGEIRPPYLRYFLPGGQPCRVLALPGVMDPGVQRDGWWPARLIAPMDHVRAERSDEAKQREFLEEIIAETWWRQGIDQFRILKTRIPAEWGAQYHLYRDSMNLVMTARLMRSGRIAHRSPYVRGLYLAGSSTHPGQWVSLAAISGILAADQIREDLR